MFEAIARGAITYALIASVWLIGRFTREEFVRGCMELGVTDVAGLRDAFPRMLEAVSNPPLLFPPSSIIPPLHPMIPPPPIIFALLQFKCNF